MDACCGIVIAIIVGFVLIQIVMTVNEKQKEKEARIARLKNELDGQRNALKNLEGVIASSICQFFAIKNGFTNSNYETTYNSLNSTITSMQSTISQMKEINSKLVGESRDEDQGGSISQAETRAISQAKKTAEGFKAFGRKVYTLPSSMMMEVQGYGKIKKTYWDSVCAMRREDAVSYISRCEYLLGSERYDELFAIDIEKVLKCVWFFATEKTFSASDFQKAESVFYRLYKYSHADVFIADMYAKKKMGGEDVLRDHVRNLLKVEANSNILTLLASGLMWMNFQNCG